MASATCPLLARHLSFASACRSVGPAECTKRHSAFEPAVCVHGLPLQIAKTHGVFHRASCTKQARRQTSRTAARCQSQKSREKGTTEYLKYVHMHPWVHGGGHPKILESYKPATRHNCICNSNKTKRRKLGKKKQIPARERYGEEGNKKETHYAETCKSERERERGGERERGIEGERRRRT